jgi:hypothetical protein
MLQAFVGIVSREGLEVLCLEHPQTVRFLSRRAQRESGRVACIWSVIPDEVVPVIDTALRQARFAEALLFMLQQAREYGLLLPPEGDETVLYGLHG